VPDARSLCVPYVDVYISQSEWIDIAQRVTPHIGIEVQLPSPEPRRILGNKPPHARRIIARSVVVEPRPVRFAAGILVRVSETTGRVGLRHVAIRVIAVLLLDGPSGIGQSYRASQRIGEKVGLPCHIIARKPFVNAQTGQDRIGYSADSFLHRVVAVIQKLRRHAAADRLGRAPPHRIIGIARLHRATRADLTELVARIPHIRVDAIAREVAISVVTHGVAVELGLTIVEIEDTILRGRGWRNVGRKTAGFADPVTIEVIAVDQGSHRCIGGAQVGDSR